MELARNNLSSLNPSEVDAIIVNVAGCGSMLKDYGHVARELLPNDSGLHDALDKFSNRVRDISEFLSELGLVPPPGELPLRVVYHDACHLVHAQRIREQPRQLLSQIPGVQLLSIREPEICCGAAGSYNLTEPEMSDRLALRKIENMLAADPQVIASPNVGCTMQLQAGFRQAGRAVWVAHPMELLDLSYRREPPPLPL
jgi:glycolate oxidase iron-sulfur subunit